MEPRNNPHIFPFDHLDPYLLTQATSSITTPATQLAAEQSPSDLDHQEKPTGRKKWAAFEDIPLCKAWAKTSVNSDENDSRKIKVTYWGRIFENFTKEFKESKGEETFRNQSGCERRWGVIQHDVNNFCGAFDQVVSTHGTDLSQLDLVSHLSDWSEIQIKLNAGLLCCY